MRTLLFTTEYPPFNGGIANYYGNLAKYWPIEENLSVLNNNRGEIMSPTAKFWPWRQGFSLLKRELDKDKTDYLLVGQILPLGTIACFWSFIRPLKYAVFLHGMDFAYALKTPRKKFLTNLILRRADKIIAANRYVAGKVREFNPVFGEKLCVINPGVEKNAPLADQKEINNLSTKYNLSGQIILFSLGRLVGRKGVDRVIKALSEIPDSLIQNLKYFIAGRGPKEDYLKSLVPLNLSDKIIFLGEISDEEKWSWMHLCDIFVMPTREIKGDFEGFGIVYLEANLCGKPVLAGRSGGVEDAVVDGYTGLLVDASNPDNINDLKQAIIRLIGDQEFRAKLGQQGQERAQRDFNWERQVFAILDFIKPEKIS